MDWNDLRPFPLAFQSDVLLTITHYCNAGLTVQYHLTLGTKYSYPTNYEVDSGLLLVNKIY